MRVKYFEDTDTALIELSDHQVEATKEINENIIIDLDVDVEGNLVGLTIEHANQHADIREFSFQQFSEA